MVVPGREILTIPDTPTTQGLSLWCFNIVAGNPSIGHPSIGSTTGIGHRRGRGIIDTVTGGLHAKGRCVRHYFRYAVIQM